MNIQDMLFIIVSILGVLFLFGLVMIALKVKRINKTLVKLQSQIDLLTANTTKNNDSIFIKNDDSKMKSNSLQKNSDDEKLVSNKDLFQNNSKLQIKIIGKSIFKPVQRDAPFPITGVNNSVRGDSAVGYLIFNDYSINKLKSALDWGCLTCRNQVEQGGILLGTVSLYKDTVYCFAEDILLAKTKGMPAFVEFTNEMWKDMQNELIVINEKKNNSEKLVIVGWFHTHPNNLSVFMSGTDMETQRLNFPLDWQVSLVMNPHKNVFRVFFGKDAKEGNIVFPSKD